MGFQVASGRIAYDDGWPIIAVMFDDPTFALARHEAVEYATTLRRMGEVEPVRLGLEEMEYTTLQQVLQKLMGRFEPA